MTPLDQYLTGMHRLKMHVESLWWKKTQTVLAVNVIAFSGMFVLSVFFINPAIKANRAPNEYIPINLHGQVINPVRGVVPLHDDEFIVNYTIDCMHQALTLSPGNYRREFMRFVMRCMTPSSSSMWSQELQRAGVFDLVKGGSMLEFTPDETSGEVIAKIIHEGRHLWRVRLTGTLTRVHSRVDTSEITMEIVVARQDPFNYESAIAIQQVVL